MDPKRRRYGFCIALVVAIALSALAASARGSPGARRAPEGRIAVEGDGDVVVVNARGGHKRQVAVLVQGGPAWSPDGREVAYAAQGAIRATAIRSGRERTIARTGGEFSVGPSWSSNGRRLAFTVHGAFAAMARLVVIGRDGRKRHTIDTRAASYQIPQWSPDGRTIAYLRDSGGEPALWVARADGRDRHVVRRGVFGYPDSVSWSPDGARIAFVGIAGPRQTTAALVVARSNGTQSRAVAGVAGEPDRASVGNVRWSPAGSRIAFLRWGQDAAIDDALCVVDPGSGRERVLARAGSIDDVTWSPDGRWLAYLTENPARPSGLPFSVWLIRADGSGKHRLARLNERSAALAWGRRGK
jgi:Tol biopolymer transport system component